MNQPEERGEEIALSTRTLKRLVIFLLAAVLALSVVFNFFILESNRRLREEAAKLSFENDRIRYERNLMDSFVAEIDAYARGNPEVEKIIAKYRIGKSGGPEQTEAPAGVQKLKTLAY
ncbi:MAG: hypothetical protein NTV79_05735 [Candidatus Aureabacteria bacterium]|nr:hypothetical protein [Candidatus Auribacterota bacterium]